MSDGQALRPPSGGMAPPQVAVLPDGSELDLLALARQITATHLERHPGELERYGPAVRDWCTHDNQHLLNWAALDVAGKVDLDAQVRWMAGVLSARGYPLENLSDNLCSGAALLQRGAGGGAQAVRAGSRPPPSSSSLSARRQPAARRPPRAPARARPGA